MLIRLITLLLCLPCFLSSQTEIADLQQSLANAKDDSSKVELAIRIGRKFMLVNFDSALQYNRYAANLARQTNYQIAALLAMERVAAINGMKGDNQLALQLNQETIQLAKEVGSTRGPGQAI